MCGLGPDWAQPTRVTSPLPQTHCCSEVSAASKLARSLISFELARSCSILLDLARSCLILLRLVCQDQNATEAILRQMEATLGQVYDGQRDLRAQLSLSAFSPRPKFGLLQSSSALGRAEERGSARQGRPERPERFEEGAKSPKAVFRSDRLESEAMESTPLLRVEDDRDRDRDRKRGKHNSRYSTLNLEGIGIPFQERLARAQILLEMDSKQSWLSRKITEFLEDPDSSMFALYYFYGISVFTLLGMFFAFLQTLSIELEPAYKDLIDIVIDSILLTETIIRFACYPHFGAIFTGEQRWENLIDCTSALPVILLAGWMHPAGCFRASLLFRGCLG